MQTFAGKQLSTASMGLYSFVSKMFLKVLFCFIPKWMKSRGRTTAKSSRLMWTQATKSFLPIVLLYWYEEDFCFQNTCDVLDPCVPGLSLPFPFLSMGQKDQADNQAAPVMWKSQRLYSDQLAVCTRSLWINCFDLILGKKKCVHTIKCSWTGPSLNTVILDYVVCNFFCSYQFW